MGWFLDVTTRVKLFLGFGVLIVLLAAVIAVAYNGLTTAQEAQRRLHDQDFANTADLLEVRTNLNGIRAALLDMMLVTKRAEQEVWHQEIRTRTAEVGASLERLGQRLRNDPRSLRRLEEVSALHKTLAEAREREMIPLIYAGKVGEAKKIALGTVLERYRKMRDIAEELGKEAAQEAQAAMVQSERAASESVRIFGLIGALAVVLGVAMAVTLERIIGSPLKEISTATERIATGDLTVSVAARDRRDEVGTLARAFRKMVENLREVNREIRDGVTVLGSAASEILATTAQVAASAVETATAVAETTTTVEEVRQTSQISSQKAKYVSDTAQKVAQVSQDGRKAVEATIEGMSRIREQMESIAQSIVQLSEQSQAIGGIIAAVNDLAEQSNLLAVNATIEAAKAGEAGRGFAVVAQEVKSLAEQSKQATAQVRGILNDIQRATSAAVMATEQGSKAVAAGVRQSTETGEAIRMLAASIAEAAQAAAQIAASSQQQLSGADQVALAMESIKQASAQNVTSTKQTESAAQNLHDLGQKLTQVVARYKV